MILEPGTLEDMQGDTPTQNLPTQPEQDGPGSTQKKKPTKRVRYRHHTLRLGLSAGHFQAIGKPQPLFQLTPEATQAWKAGEQVMRVFRFRTLHPPGRGANGGRQARASAGPQAVDLGWHTPAANVKLGRVTLKCMSSNAKRCVCVCVASIFSIYRPFWSFDRNFLNGWGAICSRVMTSRAMIILVTNFMFGAQLDKGGAGMHYQLMT